jgi:hypothetical protein
LDLATSTAGDETPNWAADEDIPRPSDKARTASSLSEKGQSHHQNDEQVDHGNVLSLVLEQDDDEKEKEYAPDRGAHLKVGHHYRNEEYRFGNWDVVDPRDNQWPRYRSEEVNWDNVII